jgi:hypothetical protein
MRRMAMIMMMKMKINTKGYPHQKKLERLES